jgi:6,7-dimethyl-8-ribityllumazine synthase
VSETSSKASSYGAAGVHEGALRAGGRRFAICAARFNDGIVARLIGGARGALREAGAADADVELYRCPGAMELAGLARRVAETGRFAGVVCLGAVIRGGTPHFDLVAAEAARGIGALSAEGRLPIAFGVLACDTLEQALARSGEKKEDNRGYDAAMVVVEMADLYAQIGAGR